MFGFFKPAKRASIISETWQLLGRNYRLNADLDKLTQFLDPKTVDACDNPHDLAIYYLAFQVSDMDKSDPSHHERAVRYIRVAKQAHKVGAAETAFYLELLLENAVRVLGIDGDSVAPSAT